MKYFLVVGEASGDLHASNLMSALKKEDPEAEFQYFGGDLMQAQGGQLIKHYRELAFMGFIPVLMNLKTILRNMKICQEAIVSDQPDVVILVDYPGFNLKIAKFVHIHTQIPVYYYISPKVWAWKEYRVKSFKKYVDKMFCILPFEVSFFKKHNYQVSYVGNPTVDAVTAYKQANTSDSLLQFKQDNSLADKPFIALLAGSRQQEIKDNLPSMLQAISQFTNYQPIIAGAPGTDLSYYQPYMKESDCKIIFDQTYRLLSFSDAALVTSGTATLETALFKVPQVVCYKTPVPQIVHWAFKHILHTPFISLVNLIANREIVKELFAKFFTIENIRDEVGHLLNNKTYRNNMLEGYNDIIQTLGNDNASEKTARQMIEALIKNKK